MAIDLIRGGDSVIPDTMIGELDLETERRGVAAELAELRSSERFGTPWGT